jgi:hypothetical protein
MAAEGELVDRSAFTPEVEDADLKSFSSVLFSKNDRKMGGGEGDAERKGEDEREEETHLRVRHTTVVPALGVGLVLAVAVAAGGSAAHLVLLFLVICGSSQRSLSSSGTS